MKSSLRETLWQQLKRRPQKRYRNEETVEENPSIRFLGAFRPLEMLCNAAFIFHHYSLIVGLDILLRTLLHHRLFCQVNRWRYEIRGEGSQFPKMECKMIVAVFGEFGIREKLSFISWNNQTKFKRNWLRFVTPLPLSCAS